MNSGVAERKKKKKRKRKGGRGKGATESQALPSFPIETPIQERLAKKARWKRGRGIGRERNARTLTHSLARTHAHTHRC